VWVVEQLLLHGARTHQEEVLALLFQRACSKRDVYLKEQHTASQITACNLHGWEWKWIQMQYTSERVMSFFFQTTRKPKPRRCQDSYRPWCSPKWTSVGPSFAKTRRGASSTVCSAAAETRVTTNITESVFRMYTRNSSASPNCAG